MRCRHGIGNKAEPLKAPIKAVQTGRHARLMRTENCSSLDPNPSLIWIMSRQSSIHSSRGIARNIRLGPFLRTPRDDPSFFVTLFLIFYFLSFIFLCPVIAVLPVHAAVVISSGEGWPLLQRRLSRDFSSRPLSITSTRLLMSILCLEL